MAFPMPPGPWSSLHRHRILSPTAGVRVSPLCLGAMNFGDEWKDFMGDINKETVFEILDYFRSQGGNFIDTASNYQRGQSEQWIGEWMKARGVRDEMVLATKYTMFWPSNPNEDIIRSNFGGNHSKSLQLSVGESLKRLQTHYIDILYLHWWDFTTSIPELMQSLNHLVTSGKVIYLGISDTPAWIVVKANEYARQHSLRQFSIYEGKWSAAERDFERDILPMTQSEGMALAPWGSLGGGYFKTAAQASQSGGRTLAIGAPPNHVEVSAALEKVAVRKNTALTSVALAYILQKAPYVFPIVGGRKIEHLKGNIDALTLVLDEEDIRDIEGATEFDVGFPGNFLTHLRDPGPVGAWNMFMTGPMGTFDYVQPARAIRMEEEKK